MNEPGAYPATPALHGGDRPTKWPESIISSEFLGLQFSCLPSNEVERWITGRNAESPFGYIVTPNVDHIVRLANAGSAIQQLYTDADLCVCDSRVLQRLAIIFGVSLPLVTGSDLVQALFSRLLLPGDRICLIGGSRYQAELLGSRYPGLKIRHHEPPMGLLHDAPARAQVIECVRNAKARIILIGVGAPQQELLAHEMAQAGDVRGTALCIGASVDFLVGTRKRAPILLQRSGMEWLWRLITEPRRLAKRYLVDGLAIFPLALRWHLARRK